MKPQEIPKTKFNNMTIADPQKIKIGMVYMDKDNKKYIYYATDSNDPSKVDISKKYYFSN
jgi:hypothetical protein